jgi:hypothetical protein
MSGIIDNVTVLPLDQPATTEGVVAGDMSEGSAALAKTLLPSGSAAEYVFATEWQCPFNGNLLVFRPGVGYPLDTALLAYLNGAGAPITAV